MAEVLRIYSNLILGVYLLIVLYIERQDYLENLKGNMMVKFDLLMVLRGVIIYLVRMIVLYLMEYLLGRLLSLVLLADKIVLPNRVVVRRC